MPVFCLHRVFMPIDKVMVLGFLLGIMSLNACTVINKPDSRLSFGAHVFIINEPADHIYQAVPVLELDFKI
jgi:uncharacterized membrane protein